MENNEQIKKLMGMDDEKLRAMILEIAAAAGADAGKANMLARDIPGLKKQMAGMSDTEAEKLVKAVGKEKAEEILKEINKRK